MGKKYSYLLLSHLKILSYWIIFFGTVLFWHWFPFAQAYSTYKNIVLIFSKLFFSIFVIFLCFCNAPNNSINSDLKFRSKFDFYSSRSEKLQDNLNNSMEIQVLLIFAISKLRNKPKHFQKFYQALLPLSGDISLNLALAKYSSMIIKYGNLSKLEVYIFVI